MHGPTLVLHDLLKGNLETKDVCYRMVKSMCIINETTQIGKLRAQIIERAHSLAMTFCIYLRTSMDALFRV